MSTGFSRGLGRIGHIFKTYAKCLNATLGFVSSVGGTGYLSVGSLTGIGVITSYIIEWHLGSPDGVVVLVSGYNPDSTVNTLHPFANEPVISGDLYAVVRYIVIDGIRYSPYYRIGQYSPDLKICFSYVHVNGIDCTNGTDGTYSHIFNYTGTIDASNLANRSIKFMLNSYANYVAYKFDGQTVVDQIKISYVSINDPNNPQICAFWNVGQISNNFTSNPKAYNLTVPAVINLRQYYSFNLGDYLLIEIVPRVLDLTNINTNWTLSLKCLDAFTNYVPPINCRKIDTNSFRIVWNGAQCRYEFYYKHINNYIVPNDWKTYLVQAYVSFMSPWLSYYPGTNEFMIPFNRKSNASTLSWGGNIACFNGSGIRYVKTGTNLFITFTSSIDYQRSKSSYLTEIGNNEWLKYVNDNSNVDYFKFLNFTLITGISCGDTITTKYYNIHHDSVFTWNDTNKTVSINLVSIINNIVSSGSCDTITSAAQQMTNQCNLLTTLADFDIISPMVQANAIFGTSSLYPTIVKDMILNPFDGVAVADKSLADFGPIGWENYAIGGTSTYYGYITGERKIMLLSDVDPANNFRIDNFQDSETGLRLTKSICEYIKINGIVVSNIINKVANNVVSVGAWTNFTPSALSTEDTSYATTYSGPYTSGVLNNFNFNIPVILFFWCGR